MTPVELKKVLDELGSVGGPKKYATSIWYAESDILKSYTEGKIMDALNTERSTNPKFSKDIPGFWECTDRAYWGVSVVRCKCPGTPMGVAIGTGKVGKVVGQPHAVIYFWTWDFNNNSWTQTPSIYDPLYGPIHDFDPKAFVSFPPYRPNFKFNGIKIGEAKLMSPFDTFTPIDKGWIMPSYDQKYYVDYFEDIKSKLTDKNNKIYTSCLPPNVQSEMDVFKRRRTREDRAFWTYNQIRDTYNRSAVAFALGTKPNETDDKKDSAAIVLWKSAKECIFWDVEQRAEISSADFEPRFVLG